LARKTRRVVHQTIAGSLDGDALPVKPYALTDPWDGLKDGKQRIAAPTARDKRK